MDQRELVAELYRTPPAEFVAARNAKAAELKKAGDKELAADVAKLRRHSAAHWALDVLAHTHRELVDTWADAADRVREAQRAAIEGRAGEDLREVLAELRRHTAALADAAPDGAPVSELPATLAAVAASEEATAELLAGLLGAGLPADDSIFGAGTAASARRRRAPAPAKERATAKEPSRAKKASHLKVVPPARDDSKLQRQLDEAIRAADDALADLNAAEAAAQEAADEESAAETEVASSAEAIESARDALAAAESRHRDARKDAAAAHKARAAADARLERARTAIERATVRVSDAEQALES